jgi:hypothetical protein
MKHIRTALALGVLAVLIVSVAGCTSQSANSGSGSTSGSTSGQNNAVTYANAFLSDDVKPTFSPSFGYTITSARVIENGSDGARLAVTFSTTNETGTLIMNIQQFSSVNDATAFFNSQSFGYTPITTTNATTFPNQASAAYKGTTGHEPSVRAAAYKVNSESFTGVQADVIKQQGEFVTWGSESASLK